MGEKEGEATIIICEGTDLTGKTTLAELISKRFHVPLFHLGKPPAGERHWDKVREALIYNPVNSVYDRMVIGSRIYGPMIRDQYNKQPVTREELQRWQLLMERLKALIIRCDADNACIEQRYKERGDSYVSLDQIIGAAENYRTIFAFWPCSTEEPGPFLTYQSDSVSAAQFVQTHSYRILQALAEQRTPNEYEKLLISFLMR